MDEEAFFSQLANAGYDYDLQVGQTFSFASDFTVTAVLDNPSTGYHGFVAFNQASCTMVISSAGSDDMVDSL